MSTPGDLTFLEVTVFDVIISNNGKVRMVFVYHKSDGRLKIENLDSILHRENQAIRFEDWNCKHLDWKYPAISTP